MPKKRVTVAILISVFLMVGIAVRVWAENQPHMRSALENLKKAKTQLEKADHDKGGHRVAAIQLIDQAIEEVHAGIAFDNKH